jgi:predicted O-methyltransferase YrrM
METPPLVRRAEALAGALGFSKSCLPEDGALLHVLAARRGIERAGEIGTGAGVGSAWIVSALPPATAFFTTKSDHRLAGRVRRLFADDPNVTVLTGDWRETLPAEAPFDLLFVDGGDAGDDPDSVVGLLTPGGTAFVGDLWLDPASADSPRERWLHHQQLSAVELWVTPARRAIVAVRR